MTNRIELPAATSYTFHKGTFAELAAAISKADLMLTYAPARKRFVELLDSGAIHPRGALRLALTRQEKAELRDELGFII